MYDVNATLVLRRQTSDQRTMTDCRRTNSLRDDPKYSTQILYKRVQQRDIDAINAGVFEKQVPEVPRSNTT
jgi:hypothetical protein